MQGLDAPSGLVLPRWVHEAACRGQDMDLFFDKGHDASGPSRRSAGRKPLSQENAEKRIAAKLICARCPVLLKCRELFLQEPHGVFGGLDREERIDLQRARSAIKREGIDSEMLGRETFERFLGGETLSEIARSHNLRPGQLKAHMEHYLRTPDGLRAQLESEVHKAYNKGLSDKDIAWQLNIPLPKVVYLRRKLGLVKRRVSQAPATLPGSKHFDSAVTVDGIVYPANYLGETKDGDLLFMLVKHHQAGTRRWMSPKQVLLGEGVRRHVIDKGVGRERDRQRAEQRDRTAEDQAEVA